MLWHPEDARDATQEILVRVITHLGSFRGESAFTTWVYRIACNHLISVRESRIESRGLTFERFGEDLENGLSSRPLGERDPGTGVETALLLEEVKIGCTLGMLLCLDRPHRLAYILGEILEIPAPEAAAILGLDPAALRKRLSRARADITTFTRRHCGLVNPGCACRCRRRVHAALQRQRLDPKHLHFASDAERARGFPRVLDEIRKLHELQRCAAVYRSHPEPRAPEALLEALRVCLETSGRGG